MKNAIRVLTMALAVGLSGCATWDRMFSAQKGTAIGAGVGGVAGLQ